MSEIKTREKNSLTTFKLLAAFQVMWGHYVHHLNLATPQTLNVLIDFFSGVPLFLMLSGFLIWKSIGRSNSYKTYLVKRFWRIYPELWAAIGFEVLTISLLYKQKVSLIDWGG